MAKEQEKYTRKNYLIRKGFQIRFSFLIFITTFVIGIIAVWTTYITTWNELTTQVQSKQFYQKINAAYNSKADMNKADMINSLIVIEFSEIFERVSVVLVMRLLVGSFLLFLLSIFSSHKIAGPLYRMENAANAIQRGDLTSDLTKLRAGDELGDLASAFNGALITLRRAIDKCRDLSVQLTGLLARETENSDKPKDIGKLQAVANKLVTEISKFTTPKSLQDKQAG